MIIFLQILIGILSIYSITGYSAPITMKSAASTSSITDYFIDFAECSCNIMPSICDNYCCCDSLCGGSVTTWADNYQCLTTSSTIQVPCGQSTKGFGAIEDLACVYYSNRGRIGYYYSLTSSTSQAVSAFSLSTKIVKPQTKQKQIITALSLSNGYTFANQYLKISSSEYLFLPFAGIGGNCVPGLVNFTASGTYFCKLIVTSSNCANINQAYAESIRICTSGDCSAFSSPTISVSQSTPGSSTCDNIINDFTLTATLGYSSGSYSLSSVVYVPNTISVNYGAEIQVKVQISLTTSTQQKSGNPGYIIGKPITMTNGIGEILSSTSGICSTSATGALTIPFGINTVYSCPSPLPCSASYYIDSLSSITLTVNKYASQSQMITVVKSTTLGCLAQTYTLTMLYSHNGWSLDPQYYIVGAILTDKAKSDSSNPTNKYLKIDWTYVDPTNVSTPPSNTFYTYFSYLWTPLKQKFGMS